MSDADPRIGANLEVFLAGSYTWIPIHYLRKLEIQPPANLRDLVWAQARVETSSDFRLQDLGEVLLPVLCPLSFRHAEESVRLGRESAWEPDEAHGQIPFGLKMMDVDGTDVPLLEIRSVTWNALKRSLKMPLREDLLTPIAGDNPAGANLYYDTVFDQIKEARREDADDLPEGDMVLARRRKRTIGRGQTGR